MIVDFGLKDKRRGRVLKNNNPAGANLSFFWRKRSHKSGIVAGKYRDSLRRPPEGQSHRSTLRPVPVTMPEYPRRDRKGEKLTGGSGRTEETLDPFPENPRPFFRKPSTFFLDRCDQFRIFATHTKKIRPTEGKAPDLRTARNQLRSNLYKHGKQTYRLHAHRAQGNHRKDGGKDRHPG